MYNLCMEKYLRTLHYSIYGYIYMCVKNNSFTTFNDLKSLKSFFFANYSTCTIKSLLIQIINARKISYQIMYML